MQARLGLQAARQDNCATATPPGLLGAPTGRAGKGEAGAAAAAAAVASAPAQSRRCSGLQLVGGILGRLGCISCQVLSLGLGPAQPLLGIALRSRMGQNKELVRRDVGRLLGVQRALWKHAQQGRGTRSAKTLNSQSWGSHQNTTRLWSGGAVPGVGVLRGAGSPGPPFVSTPAGITASRGLIPEALAPPQNGRALPSEDQPTRAAGQHSIN